MGKMGEQLCFKLWPIASGNYRHLNDTEKVMQQRRHFGIKRRFAFRQRTVQIINNELFHEPSTFAIPGETIFRRRLTAAAALAGEAGTPGRRSSHR